MRYGVHMTDVGVRELKQHLSEYLDRAEGGEVVRVTDRGRPKALLVPLPGRLRLDDGIARGWVTPASTVLPAGPQRYPARRTVLDVLSEDRGE
jgi:prevent-host-death family protein